MYSLIVIKEGNCGCKHKFIGGKYKNHADYHKISIEKLQCIFCDRVEEQSVPILFKNGR